jgi:hypothetical protein
VTKYYFRGGPWEGTWHEVPQNDAEYGTLMVLVPPIDWNAETHWVPPPVRYHKRLFAWLSEDPDCTGVVFRREEYVCEDSINVPAECLYNPYV